MSRPPRASYTLHVIGKTAKALFALVIFAICAALLWRVFFSAKLPKQMKTVEPNATLRAAYDACGGELSAFTQEQSSTTRGEYNYGYFSVQRSVIFEKAGQIQLVFRYNDSTLEATAKDHGLENAPEKGVEVYDVSLLVLRDLTPEDKSDNTDGSETVAQERIFPTSHTVTTTSLYTYFLYTFDGITLDDVLVIYLDVYYPNGAPVNYEEEPYGTLRIYHEESERVDVKLSGKEKAAIEAYSAPCGEQ